MLHIDFIQAVFLGLLQGLTEWLPISSSGHLVIAQALFHITTTVEFDVAVMLGTTLALVVYFRNEICKLALGIIGWKKESVNYAALIVIAGIPTAVISLAGKSYFESFYTKPFIVSLFIIAMGFFLILAMKFKRTGGKLDFKSAVIIGTMQGFNFPGLSRSGRTIGTGIFLGIKPEEAALFSFLVGAPAMFVASALELVHAPASGIGIGLLATGIAAAFVAGYASIGAFMKVLKKGKLEWFGYYCIVAGIIFAVLTFGI